MPAILTETGDQRLAGVQGLVQLTRIGTEESNIAKVAADSWGNHVQRPFDRHDAVRIVLPEDRGESPFNLAGTTEDRAIETDHQTVRIHCRRD